jgi:hypothetical protein
VLAAERSRTAAACPRAARTPPAASRNAPSTLVGFGAGEEVTVGASDGELERMARQMIETGDVDPAALMERLRTADPATVERVTKILEDAGANEVGDGAPLNIADFYRDAPGKFTPRWPVVVLPGGFSFDDLDRKTQFFVLFNQWTQRELEGMALLNSGAVDDAETAFNECVERARQIDVNELLARSYEGLMRVAETRGDAPRVREWSAKAQEARRAQ